LRLVHVIMSARRTPKQTFVPQLGHVVGRVVPSRGEPRHDTEITRP